MTILSSLLWVIGLFLSVVIAPQLRIWTWGPCLLFFSAASLCAIPGLWRQSANKLFPVTVLSALAICAWITFRAFNSPVSELAISDGLLLAMAVSGFLVFIDAFRNALAEKILLSGIALLLVASIVVIAIQSNDPAFSPVFPNQASGVPSGFYAHYSYCAAFLFPASLLVIAHGVTRPFNGLVRTILVFIGVAGLIALFQIKSRSGIIGATSGIASLLFGVGIFGYKQNKRWSMLSIIIAPIAVLFLSILLIWALGEIQEARSQGDVVGMLDNSFRLFLLSIAVSAIGTHLSLGGGSRSYSWESFQLWDADAHGRGHLRLEHVHNELVQTVTDYGLIGGILLGVFLLAIAAAFLKKHFASSHSPDAARYDAWRIGGFAGFVGLFAQSNFEGIFRIPPGAVMLGVCMAAAVAGALHREKESRLADWQKVPLAFSALCVAAAMAFFGYRATVVFPHLWPVYFSENPSGTEKRIDGLTEAINTWPLHSLVKDRAILFRKLAQETEDPADSRAIADRAIADFRRATKLHPYDPLSFLNLAELLTTTPDYQQAHAPFRSAISLQGGMEPAYHANQSYAFFLLKLGLKEYSSGNLEKAISYAEEAESYMTEADRQNSGWFGNVEGHKMQIQILTTLGEFYRKADRPQDAFEIFQRATLLREGNFSHFHVARLLYARAQIAFQNRNPSRALRLFTNAKQHLARVNWAQAPIDTEQLQKFDQPLNEMIKYLTEAGVSPSASVDLAD